MPLRQGGAEEVTSPPSSGPEGLGMSRSLGWALLGGPRAGSQRRKLVTLGPIS